MTHSCRMTRSADMSYVHLALAVFNVWSGMQLH